MIAEYRHVFVQMRRPDEPRWTLKCTYCGSFPTGPMPDREMPLCSRLVAWPEGRPVDHDWVYPIYPNKRPER